MPVFTGLVQAMGRVVMLRRTRRGARLAVVPVEWAHVPQRGDSIAVNGCCLTVAAPVDPRKRELVFDVVPESLHRTTLGGLAAGDRVNLEHAATLGTLLGGHLVLGHVDDVAEVSAVVRPSVGRGRGGRRGGEWRLRISLPPVAGRPGFEDLMPYITPKGSVCVEGVSLTVASVIEAQRAFEVALIPETLQRTTLARLRRGDRVNIEADAIAKMVVSWVRRSGARG